MRWVLSLLTATAALAACNNPCQALCARMADYAEECGYPVPPEEVDACIDRQASGALEPEDKEACREFGDPEVIRAQWNCEELEQYWSAGTGGT